MLGIAKRARAISYGDTILHQVPKRQVYLVLIAEDIGETTLKKLKDKLTFYRVPYLFYENKAFLGTIIGSEQVSALAITNKNIALEISQRIKEGD